MSEPTSLYIYLHTHWDREWYWSFSGYRTQLVTVVKNILDLLESGTLNNFVLDGQTALIEDVLEVSPGLAPRLKKLITDKKLFVGPWYVLADQMLVGGESLVRNLHYGLALCESFGGASRVGYCPDTFGHSADLPRILRGFDIKSAVVWRGVPRLKISPLFDWKSPDGSEVLALDLTQGYYQSTFGEGLKSDALAAFLLKYLDLVQDTAGGVKTNQAGVMAPTIVPELNGALLPVGADHVGPQSDFKQQLKDALALINKKDLYVRPQTVSLDQFFKAVAEATVAKFGEPRRLIESELRDNAAAFEFARAYMLDGVLSARLYLKRDNRLAEYKILRQAEPFRALLAAHKVMPYCLDELDYNWKLLLKNHPHDSICGCSIDVVHREMQVRTAALADGLEMLITQGKEAVLKTARPDASAMQDVRFGARHLDIVDPVLPLDRLCVFNAGVAPARGPVRLRLALAGKDPVAVPAAFQQIASHQATETFLGLSQVPVFKEITVVDCYADPGLIAPMTLTAFDLTTSGPAKTNGSDNAVVRVDASGDGIDQIKLSNEYFALGFDKDGSLEVSITGGAPLKLGHRLVDVGDAGDTYNFDPIDEDRPLAARLVSVREGQKGPLVASLIAHYQIDLPEGLISRGTFVEAKEPAEAPALNLFDRAKIRIPHKIETEIILKKDTPVVFFETTIQHSARDHRLEVVFDTPAPLDFTLSENHYSLIKRYHDQKAELHPHVNAAQIVALGHEAPLSRYPCQRFFVGGNQVFFNKGLPEYGVGDSAVSITLLRAVSYLSRTRLRTRGGGAGPIIPTPEANCPGLLKMSYGWSRLELAQLHNPSASPADAENPLAGPALSETSAYVLAEIYEADPVVFIAPQGGVADKSLSLFSLDNPAIRVFATYIDAPDTLIVRLLNVTSGPAEAIFTPGFAAVTVASGPFGGTFIENPEASDSDLELKELKGFAGDKASGGKGLNFRLAFEACQSITLFCRI
ncbi:MAG: hypothetical protein KGS72_03445 [Cyanobacteria bacterium REEB67]|nr:hypothetical protein [Cyanobacteria bacterium REEB67]